MKRSFTRIAAINLATAVAFFLALPLVAQTAEGNAARGKELFVNDACYQCHGREGQGGAAGARIAPDPIALKALIAYVRHPAGQMPPVSAKVVSDAELADIYAFLKSIPEPKPVSSIALLNQTGSASRATSERPEITTRLPEGKVKEIVAEKCVSCHTLDTVTQARHTHEQWQKVVTNMQAKGAALTPGEVPQVVDYLSQHFGAAGAQTTSKARASSTHQ